MFTSDPGYAGAAGFDFVADDGSMASAAAAVSINVLDETLLRLIVAPRDPVIGRGETVTLAITGEFSGGRTFTLPGNYVQYVVGNPAVAVVSDFGQVVGLANGTAVVVITRDGVSAATPVTVGTGTPAELQFFPETYSLTVGTERQFMVRERLADATVADRSGAAEGTTYYLSRAGVGTITADGLFLGLAEGLVEVTMIHGGHSFVAPVSVRAPSVTHAVADTSGVLVATPGGATFGFGPGGIAAGASVGVSGNTASDMPYTLPDGWSFVNGFTFDVGTARPTSNFSASFPAAGYAPGSIIYLFQPVGWWWAPTCTRIRGWWLTACRWVRMAWHELPHRQTSAPGRIIGVILAAV